MLLTHMMGSQMYENSVKSRILQYYQDINDSKPLHPDNSINLERTKHDDKSPIYQQMLNRIKAGAKVKKAYGWIVAASLIITIIVVLAAVLRLQTHNKHILEETAVIQTNVFESSETSDEFNQNQAKINANIIQELQDSSRHAGWVSYTILGVVFLAIQIIGTYIGYKYGFAGKESKKAWDYTHKFHTIDSFRAYYNRYKSFISQVGQENLSRLQSKIAKKVANGKVFDTSNKAKELAQKFHERTFLAYVEKQKNEQKEANIKHNERTRSTNDTLEEMYD